MLYGVAGSCREKGLTQLCTNIARHNLANLKVDVFQAVE